MNNNKNMQSAVSNNTYDVIVVGAGIAGLYATYCLEQQGKSVCTLEAGGDVGGTWYWNRYPGARCDIESLEYSYQFSEQLQQEWEWPERYASQKDVLRYLNHVADRFELRRHIRFNTRVASAHYDQNHYRWHVETESGESISAHFCIMATGAVSSPRMPNIEGVNHFKGEKYHTARWPHKEVDFTGKRIGIIGAGSSAIQSLPVIAETAEHVTLFQRTPNFYVPVNNQPLDKTLEQKIKSDYQGFRNYNAHLPYGYGASISRGRASALDYSKEEQQAAFEEGWQQGGFYFHSTFDDLLRNKESNEQATHYLKEKIRAIVDNKETAEKLCPDIPFGCKRLSMGKDYYETFNRDNVSLVDVQQYPIKAISAQGIVTEQQEYPLDMIIFATGFYDMVDAIRKVTIQGKNNTLMAEKLTPEKNPTMYLGLCMPDFPNLFMVTGPGSPSITVNMFAGIEQNVKWISDCIAYAEQHDIAAIEAKQKAQVEWAKRVNQLAASTIYHACDSRYVGPSSHKQQRYFMPYLGYPDYVNRCNEVAENGYKGFSLTKVAQKTREPTPQQDRYMENCM